MAGLSAVNVNIWAANGAVKSDEHEVLVYELKVK